MSKPTIFRQLYRGETRIGFIPNRKKWYLAAAIVALICILSLVIRGFNYGVAFAGGTSFQIDTGSTNISTDAVNTAFTDAGVTPDSPPQKVGSGGQIQLSTRFLQPLAQMDLQQKVGTRLGLDPIKAFSVQSIGSAWGHDTSINALKGLVIFLIAVTVYIALRYQWRMAVGGICALIFDLLIAAGVYSIVGFEVTPSTVVGLLTILGFSLYDTVVVYDKVAENSKDILAGSRTTYAEAANLAVNQTLMRSINTSLIGLLPVAGLLFVGAGILGVGTIKDLALILFIGLASGAYSSLFLATPIVVDLTEREPQYKQLAKRVAAKRASDVKRRSDDGLAAEPGAVATAVRVGGGPAPAPKPGARPQRRRR